MFRAWTDKQKKFYVCAKCNLTLQTSSVHWNILPPCSAQRKVPGINTTTAMIAQIGFYSVICALMPETFKCLTKTPQRCQHCQAAFRNQTAASPLLFRIGPHGVVVTPDAESYLLRLCSFFRSWQTTRRYKTTQLFWEILMYTLLEPIRSIPDMKVKMVGTYEAAVKQCGNSDNLPYKAPALCACTR